jgi:hypothetical protein
MMIVIIHDNDDPNNHLHPLLITLLLSIAQNLEAPIQSFSWHSCHDNLLAVVTKNNRIETCEWIQSPCVTLSPLNHMAISQKNFPLSLIKTLPLEKNSDPDMASIMYQRASMNYGLNASQTSPHFLSS